MHCASLPPLSKTLFSSSSNGRSSRDGWSVEASREAESRSSSRAVNSAGSSGSESRGEGASSSASMTASTSAPSSSRECREGLPRASPPHRLRRT
ncbi:LOW QUALITY PROTEIN: hypothetical protein RTBOTA2_006674 [Rhodotorula toruloides]|nr:LOW QUALITY PROTEIN: hypothetical protein RTBOTA2_006674 [Rhodotorula toruloides]